MLKSILPSNFRFTFLHFISLYIFCFTLAGVLLVLVRPPAVMKYIREMVGNQMQNVSNLVIEGGDQKQQQNNKNRALLLSTFMNYHDDHYTNSYHHNGEFEEEEGSNDDDEHHHRHHSAMNLQVNNNRNNNRNNKNEKYGYAEDGDGNDDGSSSTKNPGKDNSEKTEKDLPLPTPISKETAERYIKYFETRLAPKVRMICPWNLLIDYTFAYMIVDDFGLKYVPGLDANGVTISHACCALVAVYFLFTSVKEVPIGTGGTKLGACENDEDVDTPREELKVIMSSSADGNTVSGSAQQQDDADQESTMMNHKRFHSRSDSMSPSAEISAINQIVSPQNVAAASLNNNNNCNGNNNSSSNTPPTTSSSMTAVAKKQHNREHSRVISFGSVELRNTLRLEKEGLSKRKNIGDSSSFADLNATSNSVSSMNNLADVIAEQQQLAANNKMLNKQNLTNNSSSTPEPSSSTLTNEHHHQNPITPTTATASPTLQSPGFTNGVQTSSSSFEVSMDNNNNCTEETSSMLYDNNSGDLFPSSSSSSSSTNNISNGRTRVVTDPWRLKMGAFFLFLRNFIDNVDGVMARQQRKMGLKKTGFLKDVDGHLIDASMDTFGAGICFIFTFYVLYRRQPVISGPISRFLTRLGFKYHRRNPGTFGRIVAFVGMSMMGVTSGIWENFVLKYNLLFEPFVVRYAYDLVPIEQTWGVRISLYLWACVCGDSLLIMLVFCLYFDFIWDMAQYLCFFFAPCLSVIAAFSFYVWEHNVMKNPVAKALDGVPTNYKL